MALFQRDQVTTLVNRLAEPPHFIIALFGPRQTGKTTIVRQALQRIDRPNRYLAVDEPDSESLEIPSIPGRASFRRPRLHDTEWLVLNWERARRAADRSPNGSVLVLDEIQKIPQWSETVKGLWDADRAVDRLLHVVILGSSPLRMQSGLTESLAGRFESLPLPHWSFPEMRQAFGFGLDEYLFYGAYPGAAALIGHPKRWAKYILDSLIETTVSRDILLLSRIDKPALLRQLFHLGCHYSGQILSYTKMLGQLQGARHTSTLAHYLDLLAASGLLLGLQKYSKSAVRKRSSSPKFQVLNTALMSALSGLTLNQARSDGIFWGRLVESAVGAHLAAASFRGACQVFYWREGDNEVDFVVEAENRSIAIEVKSSGPSKRPYPGMSAFAKRFSPSRSLLVGSGGIALETFLSRPVEHYLTSRST